MTERDWSLDDDLRDLFGDFDWFRRCQWHRPNHPSRQLKVNTRRAAVELQRLYPPDVCANLAASHHRSLVLPLFLGRNWVDDVASAILLGHDLADAPGWHSVHALVKRLRHIEEFDSARFEIGLLAGLHRSRLKVTYEPASAAGKSPDILIEEAGLRIALEAKSIGSSDREANAWAVEQALNDAFTYTGGHDWLPCKVFFSPSDRLLQAITSQQKALFHTRWVQPLHREMHDRLATVFSGDKQGAVDVQVGDFGAIHIEASRGDFGEIGLVGVEDRGIEHWVVRTLREIRQAAEQVAARPSDLHVAVAWISAWSAPVAHAAPILMEHLKKDPDRYRNLDCISLLNSHRLRGTWSTDIFTAVLPWASHDLKGLKWPSAIGNWRLCQ